MLVTRNGFKMFTDGDLGATLEAERKQIPKRIEELNINCEDLETTSSKLTDEFSIKPLVLDRDNIETSMDKAMIPAEYFPSTFNVYRGKSYEKSVAVFKVSLDGELDLLKLRPSTFMMWTEEVDVEDSNLVFEIIILNEDADVIKKERDDFLNKVEQQLQNINGQVSSYNGSLEDYVKTSLEEYCSKKQSNDELLAKLNS